jgi:hypothetical protein
LTCFSVETGFLLTFGVVDLDTVVEEELALGLDCLVDADDLISWNGGEGGGGVMGSSFGITTGGIGTTLGMGAHVRGTVAGFDSGVTAGTFVAAVVGLADVAGRLLGYADVVVEVEAVLACFLRIINTLAFLTKM